MAGRNLDLRGSVTVFVTTVAFPPSTPAGGGCESRIRRGRAVEGVRLRSGYDRRDGADDRGEPSAGRPDASERDRPPARPV